MGDRSGRLVWRVRAQDGAPRPGAFDALVLPAESGGPLPHARHLGLAVPHEGETPDVPLTLVVRARPGAGALLVECEAFGADGARLVYARGAQPLTAVARSATGVLVTGLPAAESDPPAPTA